MPIINDDKFLAICSIILTISAIVGAPFWGLIADRLGFKKTLFIVCTVDLFCKILGLFCNKKWSIATMYFLTGFTDKGVITIIGPGLI
jgi:MFS family permease